MQSQNKNKTEIHEAQSIAIVNNEVDRSLHIDVTGCAGAVKVLWSFQIAYSDTCGLSLGHLETGRGGVLHILKLL